MSKPNSIRSAVNTKFVEMLPQLAVIGGKKFRRTILDWSVETLGITMAAAATHYNHAFHRIKECEPELVQGLGRPEGKNNGGRKRKPAAAPAVAPAPLLLTYTPAAAPATDLSVLLQAPVLPLLPEAPAAVQTFTVVRCKDGAEVATGLTKEAAEEMIAKAAAAKKAKLQIKE
jgi:hypothetical protein